MCSAWPLFACLGLAVASSPATILCLVHTASPSHETRARVVLNTWASKCNAQLFFTDSPMPADFPHIVFPGLNTREHSWQKIRRVLRHAKQHLPPFDWYLRADDDAYILVENLRTMLAERDPRQPHYLSYRWNYFEGGYADGAAYVLSEPTLAAFIRLMDTPVCKDFQRAEEDQEMGRCLAAVGILPGDTRDEEGGERFHHSHPLETLDNWRTPFVRLNAWHPQPKGLDTFSPSTVLLHHLSPWEMLFVHHLLYSLSPLSPSPPTSFDREESEA